MIGRYRIFKNNELVSESHNVITDNGKNIIRQYLSGSASAWAGSIAVGALNLSSPSSSGNSLEFEITRAPVFVKYVENSEIVCTATLESDLQAQIYELGIYPTVLNESSRGFDDKVIVNAEEDWTDASGNILTSSSYSGSETSPDGRSGYRNLILSSSAETFKLESGEDITGYSSNDSVTVLYNVSTTGTNKEVTLTFYDDTLPTALSKSYTFTITSSSTGYNKITASLGLFTEEDGFSGRLSEIEVSTSASTSIVHLDAIKFDDADNSDELFALVSRALVGVQGGTAETDYVTKNSGEEVIVEYRVEFV